MANRVQHQPHPDPGATPTRLTASLGVIELQQTTAGTTANPAARKTARDHRRQEHESQNPTPNSHNRQPPTSHTAKPGETLSPELPIGGFRLSPPRKYDLENAILMAARVRTEPGAAKLYRGISRALDNDPLIDGDLYWNGYGALETLMVNHPGIEDAIEDPFPVGRHQRPPKPKSPMPVVRGYRLPHPKRVFLIVAIAIALAFIKSGMDWHPCPSGSSYLNTSFQELCTSNATGNTVRVLSSEGTP